LVGVKSRGTTKILSKMKISKINGSSLMSYSVNVNGGHRRHLYGIHRKHDGFHEPNKELKNASTKSIGNSFKA
jgi:hypothetical protein